ncbi:uncharacterized protein [Pseudorasbora parva]|uniref:uncharacterized protein n=1 Tax=Pseudorasbora parva TaxID=51549 RepID=UPI00351E1F72
MAFIKQESEDIRIEDVFSVKQEETEEQTGFGIQFDHTFNENGNEDRTHTADCCLQTSNEMGILESTDRKPEIHSSFHPKEELFEYEMYDGEQQVCFSLEMKEEEEETNRAEEQIAEGIPGRPLMKTWMEIDESAHGCSSQQQIVGVKMSSNSVQERIYDKKNYCLYCEKPYAKITRHLIQKHSEKAEVAKALAHRQGSAMRNLLLAKLRNMGNYHHNSSVLSSGKGEIIPKRQATYKSTATDYLPCKFCFAMYVKKELWKHHKRCKLQEQDDTPVKPKVQVSSCSMLLPMESVVSSGLKQIIDDMTSDSVTEVVQSDPLILSLGERMFLKNGDVGRPRADIRNQMRELGRLLQVTRTIDKDIDALKDLINPGKFNTVLEAVKKMTGFNNSTNRFSVPSTALKLRKSLVKVSYILQGEALRQEDNALKGRAEQFSKLIELEWPIHV